MAGLAHLQEGQFLGVAVDGGGEPAQQPGPVGGGEGGPAALGGGGAADGGVHVGGGGGGDGGEEFAGGRVEDGEFGRAVCGCGVGHAVPHMRSKERRSSQSVTAASKASSSTRAMFR